MLKRFWMGILTILCSIGITIVISYAWFIKGLDVDPLATGSSTEAYYHSGTGTENDPFIITTPRHLYNLAWLQYLGAYNKDKKSGTTFPATYFKVGLNSSITIDMTGWPLPPIGTVQYPFIGNFNGNGSTITNLTTTNKFSEFGDKHPSGVDDVSFEYDNCGAIGFFGSVGAYNNSIISGYDTLEGYTYDTANNKIYNFYLNDTNVHTSRSATLIGAVAGYVNAEISDVGVIKPHLNIETSATSKLTAKTSNLSDFAVVGYAEQQYTTQKTKTSTIIYNPTYDYSHFNFQGMGSQADWGGSMNMADLYNRIVAKIPYQAQSYTYVNNELRYVNINDANGNPKASLTTTAQTSNRRVSWSGNENGGYIKYVSSTRYNYLTAVYKTVIEIEKSESATIPGYTISSNGNYLAISSANNYGTFDFNVILTTDSNDSTIWIEESNSTGVNLYTYNEDDGKKYYLNANSDLSLNVSLTPSTIWHWDSTKNSYSTSINGSQRYLNYFANEWSLKNTYAISDGNGVYLTYDGSVTDTTSISEATIFMFSIDGAYPSGKVYLDSGDYLRNDNGSIEISDDDSNNYWNNENGRLYNVLNNVEYNLQYDLDDGWILKLVDEVIINYGNNYMMLNGTTLNNSTNSNQATKWHLENNLFSPGNSGRISTTTNNITTYLKYSSGLTTTTDPNDATNWTSDNNGVYYNQNGTKLYIQYDNGWTAKTCIQGINGFYISYDSNYLGVTGTEVSNSNNPTTIWQQDSDNYIYTIINGTNYYLYAASGDVAGISTDKENPGGYGTVKRSGNTIYETGWTSYKLYYDRGWKYAYYDYQLTFTDNYSDDYELTPLGLLVPSSINLLSLITTPSILTRENKYSYEYTRTEGITDPSVFNYIPLNTENDYTVSNNNTGYIMAGGYETSTNKADIRVSQYYISNINRNSNYINVSGSGDSQKFISFKPNVIQTVNGNGITTIQDDSNNFVKYVASKKQLVDTLSNKGQNNNSNLYGLHFMSATISINHLVTAPKALINGQVYTNYQMPEDCIDFKVASRGYINFFAGTYFKANNSFFSLHEIIRDSNTNKITAIKHISKIYSANENYGNGWKSADHIYQYDDNSWSNGVGIDNTKYDLSFDKSWIETPGTYTQLGNNNDYVGRVFYFEIPVNSGEFALGSVTGRTGAYLFYLDIGANAAPVDRTEITQKTTTNQEVLSYANGIQILATGSTFTTDSNSCVAKIENTKTGLISITRTGDTVTFNTPLNSTYKDESITFNGTITPVSQSQTTSIVLKYVDYNRATDKLYFTTIYNNGTTNTSYDCYRIDDLANGTKTEITDRTDQAEWGLLKIVSGAGTHTTDVTDSAFDIDMQSLGSTKILDYYSYINTTEISTYSLSSSMSVDVNTTLPPADGDYAYEHAYKLVGNDLVLTPNGLVVYIGPDLKASATITGPTSNVVTVTTVVNNVTYTFTFNANAIDNTAKTVTIYYEVPETP